MSDINLDIERGDCVGFIGKTGSGKSTLIDIIMGLLQPTRGFMMVDRHKISMENINAWQSNIAHVPQDIFLIDDSIEKNIAFGIKESKINLDLVKRVADQAELSSLIESWPDKYKTCVGERGVQISGGQKQRIGIARALYKEADVLVLDEATSALDVATEERIMSNINKLNGNKTIIIIAHRVATLKNCKQIVKINDSTIESVCQYKDIC